MTDERATEQVIEPVPAAEDGAPPEEWLGGVHPDGQLEVTRGFHLYADKLNRVLHYLVHERHGDAPVYEQLVEATGLPRNQVKTYIQYGVAMELIVPQKVEATPLTKFCLEYDPFFDRTGTLWLLHYLAASNPLLVVWNYLCNAILPAVEQITVGEARDQFLPFIGRWSESSIRKKARKELNALFAAYTGEFFSQLDYLRVQDNGMYLVNRHIVPVPPLILLCATLVYRDRFMPGASSIEIPTLVYAEHSPGRIMRQNEMKVRQGLNELHESGWLTIEAKANLDQVRFRSGVTWLDAARVYLEGET